ncbi:MAG: hypothetical protein NTU58_04010 [Candidatus Nealsonbacteria bacterium]|nr:hypothetical protein [Candidatus Nealsonbacteria bacterium]
MLLRKIKNWIGGLKGFGTCPNCRDSWWWKEIDGIEYSATGGYLNLADLNAKIPMKFCIKEIMICKECLSDPKKLDLDKIRQNLEKYPSWIPYVPKALEAIKEYKTKALS